MATFERYAAHLLASFTLLVVVAVAGLAFLRLDLSFRPLFASDPDIRAETEEFERVFGQSSGAWVTIVVENEGLPTGEFVRTTARLTHEANQVDGVEEVLSLTSMRIPRWQADELGFVAPIPNYLLDPLEDEELRYQYADILDGSRFVGWLVSADGRKLLISSRLDSPLDDLEARRSVIRDLERSLREEAPAGIALSFSGVSVVELAYERQVLSDQVVATALTSFMLVLLLYWTFRSYWLVVVCLLPVAVAIPVTLGVMGWLELPLTIINTTIPVIVLVIGVADAVHMLNAWLDARRAGAGRRAAVRAMTTLTGKACLLTTLTTMGGFAALATAELTAVASFGLAAAAGIVIAWAANQVLLPFALRALPVDISATEGRVNLLADTFVTRALGRSVSASRWVLGGGAAMTLACLLLIPSLDVDQKFNGELPLDHPVTISQSLLEREFGGFLGPEVSVRKKDGGSVVDPDSLARLDKFLISIRALPDTDHAWSVNELLPRSARAEDTRRALEELRRSEPTARIARELVSPDNDRLAIMLRTGDLGTSNAAAYRDKVLAVASRSFGDAYTVKVVGQWWLAQRGMQLLLSDMLTSLATAMLIVLPLLWFALRDGRLFVAATAANVLPLMVPLAFMAATGMPLRIGTVVVLALALGIVVDNTLHIILCLRRALASHGNVDDALTSGLKGTGRAVVFTTIALIGGFLSMLGNELNAIRDMGLVAAVTIFAAMLADLLLLPAIYSALAGSRVSAR